MAHGSTHGAPLDAEGDEDLRYRSRRRGRDPCRFRPDDVTRRARAGPRSEMERRARAGQGRPTAYRGRRFDRDVLRDSHSVSRRGFASLQPDVLRAHRVRNELSRPHREAR